MKYAKLQKNKEINNKFRSERLKNNKEVEIIINLLEKHIFINKNFYLKKKQLDFDFQTKKKKIENYSKFHKIKQYKFFLIKYQTIKNFK